MRKDIKQIFFELIQVSLGTRICLSHTPSADDWSEMCAMAKKQSLIGICFAAVQQLPKDMRPPEMLYLAWMGLAAKIQQRNEVVNRQCVDLQKRLSSDGFESSILKGQGVGALYTSTGSAQVGNLSMLRQSGDIDVWVPNGMHTSMEWIKKNFGEVKYDYINAHVPIFSNTDVELHWRCQSMTNLFLNIKLQKWLNEQNRALVGTTVELSNGLTITTPSDEFNLFYIMLHAYNHMFGEGLGLRQLMDYYFVLRSSKCSDQQKQHVLALFRKFGMMKFATAVMWIMQSVFGLKESYLLCDPNKAEGEFILEQVMIGGNFGHHDDRKKKFKDYRIQSLVSSTQHNWYLFTHYPSKLFWTPIWLVWHFCWKRTFGNMK